MVRATFYDNNGMLKELMSRNMATGTGINFLSLLVYFYSFILLYWINTRNKILGSVCLPVKYYRFISVRHFPFSSTLITAAVLLHSLHSSRSPSSLSISLRLSSSSLFIGLTSESKSHHLVVLTKVYILKKPQNLAFQSYQGLKRCGKSCRWRWMNYLRPGLKRGNFSEEEDALITKLHEQFGNRWSTIAKSLRGRTDNEIKNHWHSHLKKSTKGDEEEKCSSWQSEATQNENICEGEAESNSIDNMTLGSSPPSSPSPSSSSGSMSSLNAVGRREDTRLPYLEIYETESSGDFWSQPFVTDNTPSLEKGGFELPLPYDDMYYDDFADLLCGLWT